MGEKFEQYKPEQPEIKVDEAFISVEGDTRKLVAGGSVFKSGTNVRAFPDSDLPGYRWTFIRGGKKNVEILGRRKDGSGEDAHVVKMVPTEEFLAWQGIQASKITIVVKQPEMEEEFAGELD